MTEERALTWVGLLTWFLVGIPSIASEIERGTIASPRAIGWIACFLLWAVIFVLITRRECDRRLLPFLLALQSVFSIVCVVAGPWSFLPILMVLVAAEVASLPLPVGVVWVIVQTGVYAATLATNGRPWLVFAFVYLAFQLFALLSMRVAHAEARGRKELAEAHAELRVTTGLLELSSRTEERLRIARDLHDLLGHHLTALSLNLELASHLASGEAKEQIEKSKALTKLLLSDVRDVVSKLRDDEPLDLGAAARGIRDAIPSPEIHVDMPEQLVVRDPGIAEVALRAMQEIVTNAVRHANARNLWLSGRSEGATLLMNAHDDGVGTDRVQPGNGLRGLRERVEHAGGNVTLESARGAGFRIAIRLPVGGSA